MIRRSMSKEAAQRNAYKDNCAHSGLSLVINSGLLGLFTERSAGRGGVP